MAFCTYCGKEIKEGSQFCVYCGKSLQNLAIEKQDDYEGTVAFFAEQENPPHREENLQAIGRDATGLGQADAVPPHYTAASPYTYYMPDAPPVQSAPAYTANPAVPPRKKKGGKILLFALIGLLLAGGGFAVYHFLIKGNSEEPAQVQESTVETEAVETSAGDSTAQHAESSEQDSSEPEHSQAAPESTLETRNGADTANQVRVFESNYKILTSAHASYQAANQGKYPATIQDLDPYIGGGVASLLDLPAGAVYGLDSDGRVTANYTDDSGKMHTHVYPAVTASAAASATTAPTTETPTEAATTEAPTEAPATTAAPTEPETEVVDPITLERKDIKIGTVMTFGRYEQDNNTENGPEAIEWIIYYINQKDVYLISKYILDVRSFENKSASDGYSSSALRSWVEGDFLEEAFTWEEWEYLKIQELDTPSNASYTTIYQGNAVKSKMGIFSLKELPIYLGNNLGAKIYQAEGTPYALAQGLTKSSQGYSPWWTRSMGKSRYYAGFVQTNGSFSFEGAAVDSQNIGVRPVICFSLDTFGPGGAGTSTEANIGSGQCTGDTWLREAPGITQKTIIIIPKGSKLYFTGKSQLITNADGTLRWWYEVIYDGRTGWASGANVVQD